MKRSSTSPPPPSSSSSAAAAAGVASIKRAKKNPFTGLSADCCDSFGNAGIATRLEVDDVTFFDDSPLEWRLRLHELQTLRLAVKINATILTQIQFEVHLEGEPRDRFCVKTAPLRTLLGLLDNDVSEVFLQRRRDVADIEIVTPRNNESGTETTMQLSTIIVDDQSPPIHDIKGQYAFEINLPRLKTIVKGASSLNAHFLTLEMHRAQVGAVCHSLVTLCYVGEGASSKYDFYSRSTVSGDEDDTFTALSAQDGPPPADLQYERLLSESYDVEYLKLILKNMDGQDEIAISVAPMYPMVFSYNLGTDRSYIRCLLSPKEKEDLDSD